MSQDWNIKSRGRVCSLCGVALEDGARIVSALKETGAGYERFDCHESCWNAGGRDWEPYSQWDGVFSAPVREEKKEPVKKEDAGELLRKLAALDDPALGNVVYVLAVMLERSKILVERDVKPLGDGSLRRIYEDRKNGDTFVILDPRIRLEEIGPVQQQVVSLLSGASSLGEIGEREYAGGGAEAGSAGKEEGT